MLILRNLSFIIASALILLVSTFVLSLEAGAQLRLSESFIELDRDHRVQALDVSNTGSDTLFVKISVAEVLDPQSPDPQVLEISDPAKLGLLASPKRLVLPPGESRRVRTVSLSAPAHDRFYKLVVEPVVGDVKSNRPLGVKILVGYAAWVLVRPDVGSPELSAFRDEGRLTLKNLGTTFATLHSGRQCKNERIENAQCTRLEDVYVLLERESTIDLPHGDQPVEYVMSWSGESRLVSF